MNIQKGVAPILVLIIVAVLALGGYLIYTQQSKIVSQPQPKTQPPIQSPTQTTTPTPSSSTLNPNTGNLYNDIKVRLNEVIK